MNDTIRLDAMIDNGWSLCYYADGFKIWKTDVDEAAPGFYATGREAIDAAIEALE